MNSELKRLTGKALTDAEIQRAFSEEKVTNDPEPPPCRPRWTTRSR